MKIERVQIKHSISRGRDTYGYNIVTAVCNGKSYRTLGGGYDMIGTVLGNWFEAEHQDDLTALATTLTLEHYVGTTKRPAYSFYGLLSVTITPSTSTGPAALAACLTLSEPAATRRRPAPIRKAALSRFWCGNDSNTRRTVHSDELAQRRVRGAAHLVPVRRLHFGGPRRLLPDLQGLR